jgi:hypothetical protein
VGGNLRQKKCASARLQPSCTSQDRWLLLRDLLDSLYKIALTNHKTV